MRIVFVLGTKFNRRDHHRFGIDIFRRRGFRVELWDLTEIYRPEYASRYTPVDAFADKVLLRITSISSAKECLERLSSDDILIDCHQVLSYLRLSHLIKEDCSFGAFLLGCIPSSQESIYDRLRRHWSNPRKAAEAISKRLFAFASPVRHLDFLLVGGEVAEADSRFPVNDKTYYLRAHSMDYDRYLECESDDSRVPPVGGLYAVFLDEDMAYHPDYLHSGIKPYVGADKYFSEINNFFDQYEMSVGIQVVVAAHPRSDYSAYGNPFKQRKVILGSTVELVKYASVVIAHATTSLSYAVLYDKPIILLSSLSYCSVLRARISVFSEQLGARLINLPISCQFDSSAPTISRGLYSDYKNRYIKSSGTPDKYIWDFFCDNINAICSSR